MTLAGMAGKGIDLIPGYFTPPRCRLNGERHSIPERLADGQGIAPAL